MQLRVAVARVVAARGHHHPPRAPGHRLDAAATPTRVASSEVGAYNVPSKVPGSRGTAEGGVRALLGKVLALGAAARTAKVHDGVLCLTTRVMGKQR